MSTVALYQSKTLTLKSCCSLDYAVGNKSIIYVTGLCKLIETYIYARKKHPLASYPAAKHPNGATLRLQIYDKRTVGFIKNTTQSSTLALAIFLLTQIPLQKFSFLLRSIIPCFYLISNGTNLPD